MKPQSAFVKQLKNFISLANVPFSDRGSRLLVCEEEVGHKLCVKLAERLTSLQPGLHSYRERTPLIAELTFIDEHLMPLPYKLTFYPHALLFKTRLGDFALAFQDPATLSFSVAGAVTAGLRFRVRPQLWRDEKQGGQFKMVRNVAYRTNGRVAANEMVGTQDGHIVQFLVEAEKGTAVTLGVFGAEEPKPKVNPFPRTLRRAERRWHRWFERAPEVADRYRLHYYYAWWIMGSGLVSARGALAHEGMMPSKGHYVGVWHWDACFHAVAYRHIDTLLAANQLRIMLDKQQSNGMIPDAIYDEGVIARLEDPLPAVVTKPPIIAWAAMKVYQLNKDKSFLAELYDPLVRWNSWWFGLNDDDADGLAQYNHPFSSGLDDSPLWDEGMPVESPDLNTYLCLQMEALARMAEQLGKLDEAAMWERRSDALLRRMLEDFYDPEAGLFWATKDHQPITVVTPFNLYPLWTGKLPEEIAGKLIDHLTDPEEFWAEYPIPTVARNGTKYDSQRMWRGPTWINVNYILIEALARSGRPKLAQELRDRTLALLMKHKDMYEFYNPATGEPGPTAAPAFGWSAALFIDLAIRASTREVIRP